MSSLERTLEARVCANLAFQKFTTVKMGFDGWPDRLILLGRGRHCWFEFKTKEGKLRSSQKNRHRQLEEEGELVYVIRSESEATRALEEAVDLI